MFVHMRRNAAGNRSILLESLCIDFLAPRYSPWPLVEVWWLGGTTDIQGKTQLCVFKVRAVGIATIVPVLSATPTQPNMSLHWPDELSLLYLGDPLGSYFTKLVYTLKLF